MMLHQTSERSELLWLAYLLTGDRGISLDAVLEASEFDAGNPFFRNWMISWARKLVIARALGAVEAEMAESVQRTTARKCSRSQGVAAPGGDVDKVRLERALLEIDLFPRCAVLLRVFEKVSLDDAASLLNASREQVKNAQAIGLAELTRNLGQSREKFTAPAHPCFCFAGR